MNIQSNCYPIGGGVGSLAGGGFLARAAQVVCFSVSIFNAAPSKTGTLDARGDAARGYSRRGGCILNTYNCVRTRDLFKTIASLSQTGTSVFDPTVPFNTKRFAHCVVRPGDTRRPKVPVTSKGFSCGFASRCTSSEQGMKALWGRSPAMTDARHGPTRLSSGSCGPPPWPSNPGPSPRKFATICFASCSNSPALGP